nr:uncharacterized protein LOC104120770 [Nicotiana tomentosiformis]
MLGKIPSWTSKFLSYSGRLQQIKTVLFSIQVYWSQIFVLPKKITHLIEATCRNFLWGGGVEMTRKAPLAWDRVCWPRTVGGFNVLHIETRNKAAVCKLLWNLHTKKDKLWVRWVHIYYGKGRQIWEVEPQQASWILTKILKAKKYLEGTGMRMTDMSQLKTFSTKKMYQKMRGEFRRLSKKDRLTKWGIIVDQTCILCYKEQECLDHLFFECEFSKELWYRLLQWQGIHRAVMIWQDEIDWASREMRSNNPSADIFRMSLTGCVYYIWQERNLRIFQHKQRSLDVILRSLVQDMFCRGCGKSKLGKK